MDTPGVALRFRDTTQGVDTIKEHRRIITQEAAVWWGWWRKSFEPPHKTLFGALINRGAGQLFILDRSTRRAFRARYIRATQQAHEVDDARVPAYYRSQKAYVAGWFLLSDLSEAPFDDDLGKRIGESTLLILDEPYEPAVTRSRKLRLRDRRCILHLSDLHFGGDYGFAPPGEQSALGTTRHTLTRCVMEDLRRLGAETDVGTIVVTGDFTTRGDWSDGTRNQILAEFSTLLQALGLEKCDLVAIPGNHDIVRYPADRPVDPAKIAVENQTQYEHERPFRTFLEELTGRRWQEPLNYSYATNLAGVEVQVCAMNSCTITSTKWTEYGYVGTGGLDVLSKGSDSRQSEAVVLKIMALHHHLIPVSAVEVPQSNGVSLTLNAVEILDKAMESGVRLVLHGHQHLARISTYGTLPLMGDVRREPMIIVSGGSSGVASSRLPGSERNTYSLLKIEPTGVHLVMRELRFDAKPGAALFDGPLPIAISKSLD